PRSNEMIIKTCYYVCRFLRFQCLVYISVQVAHLAVEGWLLVKTARQFKDKIIFPVGPVRYLRTRADQKFLVQRIVIKPRAYRHSKTQRIAEMEIILYKTRIADKIKIGCRTVQACQFQFVGVVWLGKPG